MYEFDMYKSIQRDESNKIHIEYIFFFHDYNIIELKLNDEQCFLQCMWHFKWDGGSKILVSQIFS